MRSRVWPVGKLISRAPYKTRIFSVSMFYIYLLLTFFMYIWIFFSFSNVFGSNRWRDTCGASPLNVLERVRHLAPFVKLFFYLFIFFFLLTAYVSVRCRAFYNAMSC